MQLSIISIIQGTSAQLSRFWPILPSLAINPKLSKANTCMLPVIIYIAHDLRFKLAAKASCHFSHHRLRKGLGARPLDTTLRRFVHKFYAHAGQNTSSPSIAELGNYHPELGDSWKHLHLLAPVEQSTNHRSNQSSEGVQEETWNTADHGLIPRMTHAQSSGSSNKLLPVRTHVAEDDV